MRYATRDDICGYCHKGIWVHLKHQIGTCPWYTWKQGDPGEGGNWIHDWCVYKLRDEAIANDPDLQQHEPEPEPIALEEFDEPGPFDSPRFVRIKEAADKTGLGITTLRRLIDVGYAHGFKRGGFTYINLPEK